MKKILIIISILFGCSSLSSQSLDDLSFGTEATFEVITWNIEWFPKNGQTTIDYVTQIIEALDVDLLAIQEVKDISSFNQLIDNLDAYEGYLESSYFAGLAYIYKKDIIQINDIYEIYTTAPFWSPFPRSPMVIDLNFMNQRIIVINNHFKCCGDGILDVLDSDDEETRRYIASNLLKEYVDTHFANIKTIVTGDLNDNLADNTENNVFQQIINDSDSYLFADIDIAFGSSSEWSYPTWPSHLDHVLLNNELFDEFENDSSVIQTIKIDEYLSGGWWEYEQYVSDHRPVAIKLLLNSNLGIVNNSSAMPTLTSYPNPFSSETTFSLNKNIDQSEISIYNTVGQVVFTETLSNGQTSLVWNAEVLPSGIYFAKLLLNKNEVANTKLILK